MQRECPRSGNSFSSVRAVDFRYRLRAARGIAGGTVWSLPPAVRRSGPRVAFLVLTFAGELGTKFANAAWNSGRPGDGIVQRSYSSRDSISVSALPNPYRNCFGVSETARLRF